MEIDAALDDEIEVSEQDAAIESETAVEEENADPQADLKAEIAALRQELDRFKGFDPNSVKAGLGRIPALQSAIDELKKGNLTSAVVDRLDLSDRALTSLATLMVNDSEQSEAIKGPFREYLSGMDKARTQAQEDRLRQRLLDEMKPAAPEPQADSSDPWAEATAKVTEEAQKNGIDPNTLPWGEFQSGANGSPLRAVRLASAWISEHRPDPTAARISERRRSVGNGSPQREGAGGNQVERDLQRLSSTGIPIEDEAARKRVAEALGVSL